MGLINASDIYADIVFLKRTIVGEITMTLFPATQFKFILPF